MVGSSKKGGETRQHIVVDYRAEALPTLPYHGLLHHISSLLAVPHTDTKYTNLNQKLFSIIHEPIKVIREKSSGEGPLIEQDTIENVSEPDFF